MEDSFKNPFEVDDENLKMIALDPVKPGPSKDTIKTPTYIVTPPEAPRAQSPKQRQGLNISESSMFDLLNSSHAPDQKNKASQLNEDEDPPLLEDIGIDLDIIKRRIVAIVTFEQANEQLVASPDLSGPILISILLGFLLLLGGKMHFSDIETGFIIGTVLLYLFFNFMNRTPQTIPLYNVMSFLGYSLIPMLFLAIVGIFTSLTGQFGLVSGLLLSGWSSYSCSNLFTVMLNRQDSKVLIMYPLFLFYVSFAMIIIY